MPIGPPSDPVRPPRTGPDPALVARLARLGVQLGTAGIVAPPAPTVDSAAAAPTPSRSPSVLPIEVAVPGREHAGEHLRRSLRGCRK